MARLKICLYWNLTKDKLYKCRTYFLWNQNREVLLITEFPQCCGDYFWTKWAKQQKQVALCESGRQRDSQNWPREQANTPHLTGYILSDQHKETNVMQSQHRGLHETTYLIKRIQWHEDHLLAVCVWCSCIVQGGTTPLIQIIHTGSRSHKCKEALIITVGSCIVKWSPSCNEKWKQLFQ